MLDPQLISEIGTQVGPTGLAAVGLGIVWRRFLTEVDGRRTDGLEFQRTIMEMASALRASNDLSKQGHDMMQELLKERRGS